MLFSKKLPAFSFNIGKIPALQIKKCPGGKQIPAGHLLAAQILLMEAVVTVQDLLNLLPAPGQFIKTSLVTRYAARSASRLRMVVSFCS